MLRPIIAVTGLSLLVVLAGLIYSSAFIRSSHYGAYIFFCIVYGFLCYLLFLLSGCVRSSAKLWVTVFIAAWTGPFLIGHYYGYGNTKFIVWRMVQNDIHGQFDPTWKDMNRDHVFDRYVESVTGNSSGGFPAYLSLMAHEGWSGFERTASGAYIHIERRGIWVWVAWGMHLVFLLVATAAAMGATIRDKDMKEAVLPLGKAVSTTPPAPKAPGKTQSQRNPPWAGDSIFTVVKPENEHDNNGWWTINVSFQGRDATFRAYYPGAKPTGKAFFEDIWHALYRLQSEGALAALAVLGSIEGGLTAKEALDQLMDDDKKIQGLLGSYYKHFQNDDRFFAVFFSGDDEN